MAAPVLPQFCVPLVTCGSPVQAIGNDLASQVANAVLGVIATSIQQAAAWLVGQAMGFITSTTSPQLDMGWFAAETSYMEEVLLLVVVPMLMAATIGPVLRQDGRRLFRIWGVGLPLALILGIGGSQFAGLALSATDELCSVFLGQGNSSLVTHYSNAMAAALQYPVFVQVTLGVLTILGGMALWLELLVRDAAVYLTIFFMPLALAGFIWPATAGMARRAIEILASLILSKLVIVAALILGLGALANAGPVAALTGAAMLLLAAFAPFALLKLAPVVEAGAIAHLEGMSRRPLRAATQAASAATGNPVVAMAASARSGSSPIRSTGVVQQQIRQHEVSFPTDRTDRVTARSGVRDG